MTSDSPESKASPSWLGTSGSNPFHALLGLVFEQLEPFAVVTLPLSEMIGGDRAGGLRGAQQIHGGALATLVDVASGAALFPMLDDATEMQVTTEMNIRYYRQPRSSPLRAESTVVHKGRRLAGVESVVCDADERVIARGSATYMIVPRPVAGGE